MNLDFSTTKVLFYLETSNGFKIIYSAKVRH